MTNKFMWLLIGVVVGILLTTYSIYVGPSDTKFQQTIDSLNKVIESKKKIADKQDFIINELAQKDSALSKQVVTLTQERNKARAEANKKANNPNLSNSDTLHKFFVDRYPTENKTTFSLPKESAISAARDLLHCDGDRQDLLYSDSINSVLNKRIVTKDSTIYSYQVKDSAQQIIMIAKDTKYDTLNKEYTKVNTENQILKIGTKVACAVAAILTIILIAK